MHNVVFPKRELLYIERAFTAQAAFQVVVALKAIAVVLLATMLFRMQVSVELAVTNSMPSALLVIVL